MMMEKNEERKNIIEAINKDRFEVDCREEMDAGEIYAICAGTTEIPIKITKTFERKRSNS